VLDFVNQSFDWLKDFSSSPWFYLIIFVIAVLDSVFPVVPSETTVIIGGVSAGLGNLDIPLVIVLGAAGAFVGDNLSYLIGRRLSSWLIARYARTPKSQKRIDSVIHQIHERGGLLLITARFIPGGRTLLTLSCGITGQPRQWFAKWTAIAGVIWASYAALLGYFGGKTFEESHTLAFLVAFGTALSITVLIELVRWLLKLRKSNRS
jgi:membrane-associated protein